MNDAPPLNADETAIRAAIANWAASVRSKDAHQLTRDYASDILVCDLMPPLRYVGAETHRRNHEYWFQSWAGPIECEVRIERLHISGDLALANCLTNVSGTMTNGKEADMWMRATVAFRRIEGTWKVIHEHVSAPLDPQTRQPQFDLQP